MAIVYIQSVILLLGASLYFNIITVFGKDNNNIIIFTILIKYNDVIIIYS